MKQSKIVLQLSLYIAWLSSNSKALALSTFPSKIYLLTSHYKTLLGSWESDWVGLWQLHSHCMRILPHIFLEDFRELAAALTKESCWYFSFLFPVKSVLWALISLWNWHFLAISFILRDRFTVKEKVFSTTLKKNLNHSVLFFTFWNWGWNE